MKIKKLFALIAIVSLLFTSFSIVPSNASSNFTIENGVLTKWTGTDTVITIPNSVTIPSSVVSISYCAFSSCKGLTSAIFLGNAPQMGARVFDECASKFMVYYSSRSTGFTNPWHGYSTEIFTPISTATPTATPTATATPTGVTINIGDYLQMGKYYDEPILWRCVDIDENGPLMLSDRILTIKPFDAAGNHTYLDGTPQADTNNRRTLYGSNLWETSCIRSWLNSDATAGNVTWLGGCPPTEDKVNNGWNEYSNEKGFLADGNFTEIERSAMITVTQKSLLNVVDVPKLKEGGTEIFSSSQDIETLAGNYDTAYYQNVTDKMFLLDVKQTNKLYLNENILGKGYYLARLSKSAENNSEEELWSWKYTWDTTLRSPNTVDIYPDEIRLIINSVPRYGYIASFNTYRGEGIRPAFYFNISSVDFESGNGSVGTPYVVDLEATPMPTPTPTPTLVVTLKSFPDVNASDFEWAQESVEYLAGLGIINGTMIDGQLLFLPANTITRAEVCKIIVVAYGLTQEGEAKQFVDIAGHREVKYIDILSSQGIVKGYDDNTFKPDAGISREELAVMISRAMSKKNVGTQIADNDVEQNLAIFQDQATISSWARKDVAFAVLNGIIMGNPIEGGGFNFLPLNTANRAEAAVMIRRAYDKLS